MELKWTSDLSVGIDEIDRQHEELFSHINRLMASVGRAGEETVRMFEFLEGYVRRHFETEEKYMDGQLAGYYPEKDAKGHMAEHIAFIRDYREYRYDLEAGGSADLMAGEFKKWMQNWWIMHVSGTDRKLGAALRNKYPFMARRKV